MQLSYALVSSILLMTHARTHAKLQDQLAPQIKPNRNPQDLTKIMEKYEIYRLIHFTGIFVLMFAFGSLFTGEKSTKAAAIGHGIGLILILLGGFGMHSSPIGGELKLKDTYNLIYGTKWPLWLLLKVVIWVLLGGAIVLAKRRLIKGAFAWILIIGLALGSYLLAYKKPAMGNTPTSEQSK